MSVVVVGGGVAGLFTAKYLAEDGLSVTVYERGMPGQGSVHAAGIIEPNRMDAVNTWGYLKFVLSRTAKRQIRIRSVDGGWLKSYISHFNEEPEEGTMDLLKEMAKESYSVYKAMAETRNDFDYSEPGLTVLYETQKGLEEALEEERRLGWGIPFDQVEAQGFAGGIHYPSIATVCTELFAQRMFRELLSLGVRFQNTEVTSVDLEGAVETDSKRIRADSVVVAAGVGCRTLGIPVTSVKGYGFRFKTDSIKPGSPALILDDSGAALVRFSEWTKATGGVDFEFSYSTDSASSRIKSLSKVGLKLTDPRIDVSAGFRPCSPNGLPIIGRKQNTVFVTGGFRLGWSFGPAMGRLSADLVLGKYKRYPTLSLFTENAHSGTIT